MSSGSGALIVALDVGTSSVRTLLFDEQGRQRDGFGQQITYDITTTPDGGVEVDPAALADLCDRCLSTIHGQLAAASLRPNAIAFDAFWHSFLGLDATGKPVTPIVHLFDTRSTEQVHQLEGKLDAKRVHARTGCRLHTSYWPAKLLWLSQTRPDAFAAAKRWMSFGEYLFQILFGKATASTSMVSGSGLWNQQANTYDQEVLGVLPIQISQLCAVEDMDQAQKDLLEPHRSKWPLFNGVPWYPAIGDGAGSNVGSACTTRDAFSLMVGTSGAMRAVLAQDSVEIPEGLWCYRVDRKRYVLGGALSNGGEVYAWMRRTLQLPAESETENLLRASQPGSHGLVLLPFFAGERSPYWRADLRAAITGMNLATKPVDILQAALESVSLRFREIFELMQSSLGTPRQVIASGGGLLHSQAWSQMMADALGVVVVPCLEHEATGRGAALLALEHIGAIANISDLSAAMGDPINPRPALTTKYEAMLQQQRTLYSQIFAPEK